VHVVSIMWYIHHAILNGKDFRFKISVYCCMMSERNTSQFSKPTKSEHMMPI